MKPEKNLRFQDLKTEFDTSRHTYLHTARAKVPGGWLVALGGQGGCFFGVTFYPDPMHTWDGASLD